MAKVVTVYTNGNGGALYVTLDVTPSWWSRQKPNAYGAVAARVQKGFFLGKLSMSHKSIEVSTPLFKEEPLEPRILELIAMLEEHGQRVGGFGKSPNSARSVNAEAQVAR